MKKVLISLLLLFVVAPSFSSNVLAQSRHKNQTPPANQSTFRVYAVLKIISKNRMSLDFGQKAEGGYFYGQINDILLDTSVHEKSLTIA